MQLGFSSEVMEPPAVHSLGLATRLMLLHISHATVEATQQQLAEQLSKLRKLRDLWLDMKLPPLQLVDVPGNNLQAPSSQDDADESSLLEDGTGSQERQRRKDLLFPVVCVCT